MYAHAYPNTCKYTSVHMHAYTSEQSCKGMYAYTYTHMYMYTCTYVNK